MQPDLHPRNRDFDWQPRQGPFRRLTPQQVGQFDREGFVVVEDAFDSACLARVLAEIDPEEARMQALLERQSDGRLFIARAGEITFTPHLVTRSAVLREFVREPVFQDLCHDLVGPDVRLYWDQAVYKKPGTVAPFPWHQDNGYTYLEPQQYLTCWVALTDATLENGCPWLLPGLHLHGTLAHEMTDLGWRCLHDPGDLPVPAPAAAGSIVVFSSLTPHFTGPNTGDGVRKSYIVQYAPDGAVVHAPGGPAGGIPANDPQRQFPILVGGVAAA